MYHYVEKPDQTIKAIADECFGYKGKKFTISTDIPSRIISCWDEGSRNYYAFYSLVNRKVIAVGDNHPMFTNKPNHLEKLPERVLLVRHTILRGKDMGVTIYANQSDIAPMLPKNEVELTSDEILVLSYTKQYKSSYAGISDLRYHEAKRTHGTSREAWLTAKESLIEKGLLDKRGAITAKGRNAVQGKEIR